HRLELEVAAGLLGMPRVREHAVRHVDRAEPERRLRRRRQRGHHRLHEGQRHDGAERTAQKRATGQMQLGNEHGYSSFARATLLDVSAGSSLVRIWNGAFSSTPTMMDA